MSCFDSNWKIVCEKCYIGHSLLYKGPSNSGNVIQENQPLIYPKEQYAKLYLVEAYFEIIDKWSNVYLKFADFLPKAQNIFCERGGGWRLGMVFVFYFF